MPCASLESCLSRSKVSWASSCLEGKVSARLRPSASRMVRSVDPAVSIGRKAAEPPVHFDPNCASMMALKLLQHVLATTSSITRSHRLCAGVDDARNRSGAHAGPYMRRLLRSSGGRWHQCFLRFSLGSQYLQKCMLPIVDVVESQMGNARGRKFEIGAGTSLIRWQARSTGFLPEAYGVMWRASGASKPFCCNRVPLVTCAGRRVREAASSSPAIPGDQEMMTQAASCTLRHPHAHSQKKPTDYYLQQGRCHRAHQSQL